MRGRRRARRSYRRVKIAGIVLLVLIVCALGVFAAHHSPFSSRNAEKDDGVTYIMVLGVDRRADDVGRSDTLMVASIDKEAEKAALLSIPRDTRVPIEGHGYDKINHAYAYGGHALSQKSVESLLGVPMDYYILVDIKAFERIIDAIGGVDIDVEKRMYYEDPWDDDGGLVIDLYPGEQHMDGKKAIEYVRYRDGEGDIGRIGRQQKFMKAVLAKLISPEILPRIPSVVEEVKSSIDTDMSVSELLEFAGLLKSVQNQGLTAQMVPGKPAYYSDISYWIPDIVETRSELLAELGRSMTEPEQKAAEEAEASYTKDLPKELSIAEKKSEGKDSSKEDSQEPMKPEEISVMVINSSGINGAGAHVAAVLQRKGFIISGVKTGRTSSREQTTITTSKRNTDVFYGMPFPCIIMEGGGSNQAVVNIGRDYASR